MAKTQKQRPKNYKPRKRRVCFFCTHPEAPIDYKDVMLLRKFITDRGKITPRRRTGCCPLHQRDVARAIKRSRVAGLVPYYVD